MSRVILSGDSLVEADVVCMALKLHCTASELRGFARALYANNNIDSDVYDELMTAIEPIDEQAEKVIDWIKNTREQWNGTS